MLSIATTSMKFQNHTAEGNEISVLPRIFEQEINIAIMCRRLPADVAMSVAAQCRTDRAWQFAWLGKPDQSLSDDLRKRLPQPAAAEALIDDITSVAEATAYLFNTETVGIRLRLLNAAMCPRFHCDNLPVRLVTTYMGPGSEWLPEYAINRAGLGAPHPHRPEIIKEVGAIQRMSVGDIALIKGSGWEGNEDYGLVHRSPALKEGEKRLLLTIDPA
ncbi:hypothetical protein LCGC14_0037500 [marine sediment metagenome]|uniref:DUF1826 domain-containing protein n=1 Tax=marine sediment metagenome TaxID=412755 RepID=A0A0F9WAP1_9ZZZZ|nr:DUF1826 domain-containing protein [Halomonas sp.]HDZ48601.1 DUF1826 domain-containing protein [Halomonas sp.]HEB04633.1 DUF1826 domain-containing protein [Halomonas sp.]